MKKIISIALCAVMLVSTAIFTTNGATDSNVISYKPHFELVGEEIYVPANKILKSTYNLKDSTYPYYVKLSEADNMKKYIEIKFTDCQTGEKYVNVTDKEYNTWIYDSTGGGTTSATVNFNKGAYYQKVRVRMCDFRDKYTSYQYQNSVLVFENVSYFLEDGRYYHKDTDNGEMIFDFSIDEGVMESGLIIISGSVMTAVKPDSEGMVEFYIKKELENSVPKSEGSGVFYGENYVYSTDLGGKLKMGVGNVESDTFVNVKDATLIQKYSAELETLSAVQKYFADVNFDGRINVMDSTAIQKYCVGA